MGDSKPIREVSRYPQSNRLRMEEGHPKHNHRASRQKRRSRTAGRPAEDCHSTLATQQQDQAGRRLGPPALLSREGFPLGCGQTRPVTGGSESGERTEQGLQTLFLNCTKVDALRNSPEQRKKKRTSLRAAVSEKARFFECLSNLFCNQEVAMGLTIFCKGTFGVTFSGNKFEWHHMQVALLFFFLP